MKLTTIALSSAIVIATTAAAFATCSGKHRMSCADGSVYDSEKGVCVSAETVSS